MAEMRVYDPNEWAFLNDHPNIIWENGMPVYYQYSPSAVHGVSDITRHDVYLVLKPR